MPDDEDVEDEIEEENIPSDDDYQLEKLQDMEKSLTLSDEGKIS